MKDQFVTYEIAKRLKELGFNEPCWAWYNLPDQDTRYCYSEGRSPLVNDHEEWEAKCNNRQVENIGLPLWQQAIDWLREKYREEFTIEPVYINGKPDGCKAKFYRNGQFIGSSTHTSNFDPRTYEQVRKDCIERILEVIK